MSLTGLEKTAIVMIVIIVYYVIMMIISIILRKTNHTTAARWVKTLSILNYPFKKLDEYSVHVEDSNKYRTIAQTYAVNKALDTIESHDLGKKLIEERVRPQDEASHEPVKEETTPELDVF